VWWSMDVAIIGNGNLGRYHAHGVVASGKVNSLFLYDKDVSRSIALCRELEKIAPGLVINVLPQLDSIRYRFDLAVIASTATHRLELLNRLLSSHEIQHLVIEKLLEQSPERIEKLTDSAQAAEVVWVNHPKPMMQWHQSLATLMRASSISSVLVTGPHWGLVTAGVHYLQLVEWWTGHQVVSGSAEESRASWFPSKRAGYWEMFGCLSFELDDGTQLNLKSLPVSDTESYAQSIEILVNGDSVSAKINEVTGEVSGLVDGHQLPTGQLSLQSALTADFVEEISTTGRCGLPRIESVVHLHSLFTAVLAATNPPPSARSEQGLRIT